MHAFWTGALAGYGIAIPVGAIAILILETGLREGFAKGFFAGAGAASADFLYATVAVAAGSAAAVAVASIALPLKIASGLVLLALGGYGLWKIFRKSHVANANIPESVRKHGGTYLQFLGLTLLNPMTVVYFAALIVGGSAGSRAGVASTLLFVLGAGLASLSWQTLLAALASLLKKRLPAGMRRLFSLAGNLIVAAFGAEILLRLAV